MMIGYRFCLKLFLLIRKVNSWTQIQEGGKSNYGFWSISFLPIFLISRYQDIRMSKWFHPDIRVSRCQNHYLQISRGLSCTQFPCEWYYREVEGKQGFWMIPFPSVILIFRYQCIKISKVLHPDIKISRYQNVKIITSRYKELSVVHNSPVNDIIERW